MSYEDIQVQAAGPIVTITIDRPDNANMLRRQTTIEFADALRTFGTTPRVASPSSREPATGSSASAASMTTSMVSIIRWSCQS